MLVQTGTGKADAELAAVYSVLTFATLDVTRSAVLLPSHMAAHAVQTHLQDNNSAAHSSAAAAAAEYLVFLKDSDYHTTATAF